MLKFHINYFYYANSFFILSILINKLSLLLAAAFFISLHHRRYMRISYFNIIFPVIMYLFIHFYINANYSVYASKDLFFLSSIIFIFTLPGFLSLSYCSRQSVELSIFLYVVYVLIQLWSAGVFGISGVSRLALIELVQTEGGVYLNRIAAMLCLALTILTLYQPSMVKISIFLLFYLPFALLLTSRLMILVCFICLIIYSIRGSRWAPLIFCSFTLSIINYLFWFRYDILQTFGWRLLALFDGRDGRFSGTGERLNCLSTFYEFVFGNTFCLKFADPLTAFDNQIFFVYVAGGILALSCLAITFLSMIMVLSKRCRKGNVLLYCSVAVLFMLYDEGFGKPEYLSVLVLYTLSLGSAQEGRRVVS